MAGVRVLVWRRMILSFPSNFQASSSAVVPLNVNVNTVGWVSGVLEVILYTKSITGAGATAKIAVFHNVSSSDGRMATSVASQNVADVTITSGTLTNAGPPQLHAAPFVAPICGEVGVALMLASAAVPASGDVEFEVYLVGRDA